jgi:radical SAM family uncharacterized protein/radical SAM-linked protein
LSFKRPSRYINGELHSIHKNGAVKVALAFPDIYEIGMSHLGLKVLYSILNDLPFVSAERVFSPWLDLAEAMHKEGTLLSSLESARPLKDFDIVGFSLQYELAYATVLDMLHLGGIPVRSEERLDRGVGPIVIAGGPCTLNPYPMAPFIDAFLVGDGEDAVKDIAGAVHDWKISGTNDRQALLRSLAKIEGVFVPSLGRDRVVRRRIIASLEDAPFPDRPIVPFTRIVHDRINIEIARGCSMGCRFCQAGMAYRPVRERSPQRVLELAERSLRNTGYEDISFTSLSSGDYSCLYELMKGFNSMFAGKRVAISLPSLRVGTVSSGILRQIRTVRKTGFTIAPEAGTDRLRAVINKDFSEETYIKALETLFTEGWLNLKMYFMTGLPTETDTDIAAIPEMVRQAAKLSKKITGRHVNISVGVSSFIPKPHTPFQWHGQNDMTVLREKNDYIKRTLLRMGVKYKGHNEEMSLIEAVFARGDESIAAVIEEAWRSGCRLDAWTEAFDFRKWQAAFEAAGVDPGRSASMVYDTAATLPWDAIQTGVSKTYLLSEYDKATSARFTPDCRRQCGGCGLKCRTSEDGSAAVADIVGRGDTVSGRLKTSPREVSLKVRMRYAKTGRARYLSHLELTTAVIRAMRRADFPFRYSSGFHPAPRVSFGPALGVGVAGLSEYLDLEVIPPFRTEKALAALNDTLPDGIFAEKMIVLPGGEKSLDSFIIRYCYEIRHADGLQAGPFLDSERVVISRDDGPVDIRPLVETLEQIDAETFRLVVKDSGKIRVRLDEVLPEVFGLAYEELDVTRTAMFGWDGEWSDPIERASVWTAKS